MKKIKEIVSGLLGILLIVGLGFGGGYWYCSQKLKGGAEVVENAELGMKLPGETVKRIVTVDEIETEGLSRTEEQGIYEKAEEHLKNMILHFLSGMDGYQVKFL